MTDNINTLKKIELKGLWGEVDIDWELDPKVNILIGKNGVGKTTLINLIYEISNKIHEIEQKAIKYVKFNNIKLIYSNNTSITVGYNMEFSWEPNIGTYRKNLCMFDKISTFELLLEELEQRKTLALIKGKLHPKIRTELDLVLLDLIDEYKNYQLKLRNKERSAINKLEKKIKNLSLKDSAKKAELQELQLLIKNKDKKITEIYQQQQTLIDNINILFADFGKTFAFDKENAITFYKNKQEITAYQLSSGEKQLLIILLTIILQENKPCVVLMDEPEISLHLSWQLDLIEIMQKLNPNAQLIIATHSPAIFTRGWKDKIVRMEDITSTAS